MGGGQGGVGVGGMERVDEGEGRFSTRWMRRFISANGGTRRQGIGLPLRCGQVCFLDGFVETLDAIHAIGRRVQLNGWRIVGMLVTAGQKERRGDSAAGIDPPLVGRGGFAGPREREVWYGRPHDGRREATVTVGRGQ